MPNETLTRSNYESVVYERVAEVVGSLQEAQPHPKQTDFSLINWYLQRLVEELYIQALILTRKNVGLPYRENSATLNMPLGEGAPDYEPNEIALNAALLKAMKARPVMADDVGEIREFARSGDKASFVETFPGLSRLAVVFDILNNSKTEYLAVYIALLKIFEDVCALVEKDARAEVARTSSLNTSAAI